MKFQCDRCKTRYSIADERVRGKILKIRCKNCEAVITVREGMDAPSARRPAVAAKPKADSKPVLRGAFERAMGGATEPGQADFDDDRTVLSDGPPPPQMEEEWYVSVDGEQFGPFTLAAARDWVAARDPGDELYCWSEGFDDWLPTEKVSHFRGLRGRPPSRAPRARPASPVAPVVPAAQPAETTPKPLFAATLDQIEREESSRVGGARPAGANGRSASTASDAASAAHAGKDAFEFDVGEASRVVKLPMLADSVRAGSASPPLPGMAGADRIGAGSGAAATIDRLGGGPPVAVPIAAAADAVSPDVLQPRRSPARRHVALLAGVAAVALVGVIGAVIAFSGDDAAGSDPNRLVRARSSAEGLGETLDPRTIKIVETKEVRVPVRSGGGGDRRSSPGASRGGSSSDSAAGGETRLAGKTDDFDFGASSGGARELTADDVAAVYRDNQLAVKLCYERALKKDPLLDVRKVYVDMTIAPSGVVTDVRLSDYANTELGRCIVSRMRRWRFRQSTKAFTGRFPLVFRN
ncbi:MAG: DUF4339 domain-containing protein [Deltaproteobacteria bacterium]|nr:MAG: DUF4339 domain-containing protein [Deltaproteobacteria bacterium]